VDRETRGMLVGAVLGDGHINTSSSRDKRGYVKKNSLLRVLHGMDQREYCECKAERIRKALGRKFKVTIVKNGPGGKYRAAQFAANHPYFRQLKQWIYPGGQKWFSRPVLDMLTPEGIALWFMDDGHARRNRNRDGYVTSVATDIATDCSEEEAQTIVTYFQEVHGVGFRVIPSKGNFSIQASTEESRKFARLVQPHIFPCMEYKLSHVDDLDSHERRAPVTSCSQCGNPVYENCRGGLCNACYSKNRYHAQKKSA